ncbi:Probable protease SohB [Candidatus Providencia siddallii]|uniref:Probable protease SohB n=1 Tax=Candidatus Providencia siddallii TaxID=1715285 RepID=A0A0M6W904_9GAMM|nr:Probable protease SohB [Candidatus Providencia siddallii]
MEYFSLYILFLSKVFTIIVSVILFVFFIFGLISRRGESKGFLKIIDLSEKYQELQRHMLDIKSDSEKKIWLKIFKKRKKSELKFKKCDIKTNSLIKKPCLYVLDFNGSMDAFEVTSLRKEVTAILSVADKNDEVLLRLESSGGIVSSYGLAASQLLRIKEKKIPLIITVDKIAASGGYMMACVADKIIAAPFSIIGSIGVVAQVPNIHRLLKKHDIDVELHTAGEYKRTLTLLGENTEKNRKKFINDLNLVHELFKQFIYQNRPLLDINSLATGEHWYGTQALDKGLVDEIGVSDDIIVSSIETKKIISVRYILNKKILDKFTDSIMKNINKLLCLL